MPEKLLELLAFLESNLERAFSLRELARRYGCSVSHLMRLFHQHCRSTPYRMLTEMRMRRAVGLLLETELSVKEIAAKVGEPDQAVEIGGLLDKAAANCPCVSRRFCEKSNAWIYRIG